MLRLLISHWLHCCFVVGAAAAVLVLLGILPCSAHPKVLISLFLLVVARFECLTPEFCTIVESVSSLEFLKLLISHITLKNLSSALLLDNFTEFVSVLTQV